MDVSEPTVPGKRFDFAIPFRLSSALQSQVGNTAGRLFDAMVRGCIPVLMFHPDSYPVLPFVAWIPWNEFAMVFSIESEDDAATALRSLLATSEEDRQMRRKRTLQYAPMISLALQNCPAQITGALDLVSKELEEKVGLLNSALAGLRIAAPPADDQYSESGATGFAGGHRMLDSSMQGRSVLDLCKQLALRGARLNVYTA
eukprot:s2549_g7.t1